MNFKLSVIGESPLLAQSADWSIWEFYAEDLPDFKRRFFKRFGNVGGTNKAMREKQKIKSQVKQATSLDEIQNIFLCSSHWTIELEGWG